MEIPFNLSNVAQTVIQEIEADNTLVPQGAGNQLIFAGIVLSPKGKPFEALNINRSNVSSILGAQYHPSMGIQAESLRHVADAVKGGAGVVVRVVPDGAKYPIVRVIVNIGGQRVETDALPFATQLALNSRNFEKIAFYIVDGDTSVNRSIEITLLDSEIYGPGMYQMTVFEEDSTGYDLEIEKNIFSLNVEAVDENKIPAYIESVLERKNSIIRAVIEPGFTDLKAITKTKFVGGASGDYSTISPDNYAKALSVLRSSVIHYTHTLGLGCYDTETIKGLDAIANSRRIQGYYDLNPRLSYQEAIQAKTDIALISHRACFYHFPYSATDPKFKSRAIWGISGVAFRAKAIGVAKKSPVGGWHYTNAGENRAIIDRSDCRLLPNTGEPNFELMYQHRINKLGSTRAGYLFIDDSITSTPREVDLRFEQVVSVTDVISRDVQELANQLKHEPDGVTYDGLVKGVTRIAEGYKTINALVPPQDPSADGAEPYRIVIKKMEKDLWKITLAVCPSGSGRRFLIEPILIH